MFIANILQLCPSNNNVRIDHHFFSSLWISDSLAVPFDMLQSRTVHELKNYSELLLLVLPLVHIMESSKQDVRQLAS